MLKSSTIHIMFDITKAELVYSLFILRVESCWIKTVRIVETALLRHPSLTLMKIPSAGKSRYYMLYTVAGGVIL